MSAILEEGIGYGGNQFQNDTLLQSSTASPNSNLVDLDPTLKKMSDEHAKMYAEQTKLMTSPELTKLQKQIEGLLEERDRVFLAQKMSKEQLLSLFNSRGFYPKVGDKFWKVRSPTKGRGFYGWQVGQYEHSCHIDTTDLIVLLIIEPSRTCGGDTYVTEYAEFWLSGPIIV